MSTADIDILMVTYNRAAYTRKSLGRLLETCDDSMRVWLWHNGNHEATLEVVREFSRHPRVHAFHHSLENQRLLIPTNWFWSKAQGKYLSKIDDDNLMPDNWAQTLRALHEEDPRIGVVGCWSFRPEDHRPEIAEKKVISVGGNHRLLQNCWVAGTGHLMKRSCIDQNGLLKTGQSFTNYCIHLAASGWINGWFYPFVYMENLDDPRSPHTGLKSESDFQARPGLSAARFGVRSLEQLRRRLPMLALELQACSTNPTHYLGFQGRVRRLVKRLRRGRPL